MGQWVTAGILTNPVINTILADTGPLTESPRKFTAIVSSNVQAVAVIEHMDAGNTVPLKQQGLLMSAFSTAQVDFDTGTISLAANERIRIRLNAAVTGTINASLMFE